MATKTNTPREIAVTTIGPNGVAQLEVHAAGCADLNRPKYRRSERTDETTTSLEALTWSWYQDQIAESDDPENWESYAREFKVFPCVGHLPHTDADAVTHAPAKRTTATPTTQRANTTRAPWTAADVKVVRKYLHLSNAEIAAKLNRSADAVKHARRKLVAA
jgi:hypothetical protein